jgi:transcriptional regulator with XRE-family HTH domain
MAESAWSDNVRRILGLHSLEKGEAAKLLGVSAQAVTEWTSKTRKQGTREPNVSTLQRFADFFELPGSLAWTPFSELLSGPLSDADRFERVEKKIRASRAPLRAVSSDKTTDRRKRSSKVEKSGGR